MLQAISFLGDLGVVLHGYLGPQLAPRNLATLSVWVHYRGLVVLALLFAGNLFCMACPLTFPRELARFLFLPRLRWPKVLRNKWLALLAFVSVLFLYERFDLWSTPYWTANMVVGYWAVALLVDSAFKEASFCKYVCPLGQFNFLAATLSPAVVTVRDPAVCASCRTLDCIRGREPQGDGGQRLRGCEMGLFQPRKVGNLDCTFCLDCARACPHDNVRMGVRSPGSELWLAEPRSGIGRLGRRPDLAALALVFTFGALMNALGMVEPAYAILRWLAAHTSSRDETIPLALLFLLVMVVAPVVLVGAAALLTRSLASHGSRSVATIATRFSFSLLPIGFAVWLSHYGFHFLTGGLTIVPVLQEVVAKTGVAWLGAPRWSLSGMPAWSVYPLELGLLGLGALGSQLVAFRIAERFAPGAQWRAFAPWSGVGLAVSAAGLWLLSQPMEMRGTFLGS